MRCSPHSTAQTHWLPLQSSPEMLNGFATAAGLAPGSGFSFVDVWGLDDELLAMVPGEKLALTLLFDHTSEKLCAAKTAQAAALAGPPHSGAPADLFYVKQFVGNACGTIAATHVLANAKGCRAAIPADSALGAFYGAAAAAHCCCVISCPRLASGPGLLSCRAAMSYFACCASLAVLCFACSPAACLFAGRRVDCACSRREQPHAMPQG